MASKEGFSRSRAMGEREAIQSARSGLHATNMIIQDIRKKIAIASIGIKEKN
jgi:hypothetical protein